MGIKKRNLDEQHIVLQGKGGALAADANIAVEFAEFDYHVKNVYAEVLAVGTTGSTVVDVNKNGTTIFSGAGKITFTTLVTAAIDTLAAGMNTGSKGDKFSLDIDSIHTTPPEHLVVHIVLTKREPRGGSTPTNVAPSAL
jgi:hypothetical protein